MTELKGWDLRTDVFNLAIPLRENNPASWPTVRVVHIPTGFVETDRSTPSSRLNRLAAVDRLTRRVGEHCES